MQEKRERRKREGSKMSEARKGVSGKVKKRKAGQRRQTLRNDEESL